MAMTHVRAKRVDSNGARSAPGAKKQEEARKNEDIHNIADLIDGCEDEDVSGRAMMIYPRLGEKAWLAKMRWPPDRQEQADSHIDIVRYRHVEGRH